MDDKQLAKLIRKNSERAAARAAKPLQSRQYDKTLQNRPEYDKAAEERADLFKQMKRREF